MAAAPQSHASARLGGANAPRKRPANDMDYPVDFNDDDVEDVVHMTQEEEEVDLGEAGRNWTRPPVTPFNERTTALVFQQLEVDFAVLPHNKGIDRGSLRDVPVLRMFGVNEAGNSVCVFVHNFEPYFYIERPEGWSTEELEVDLLKSINDQSRNKPNAVKRIEIVRKASIWQYQNGQSRDFLKIVCTMPNYVSNIRGMLESGLSVRSGSGSLRCSSYESNVPFTLRFMVDCGIVGGSWVELRPDSYFVPPSPRTYCQIEAHVSYENITSHAPEGEWSKIAPFRVMSMDIECSGRKGVFPEAKQDPVIQIASMVTLLGHDAPTIKNVMTLGGCSPIVGAEVMAFQDERALLRRWMELLVESDPDVIIGYNIVNFDLPYLWDRAVALDIQKDFHQWGRIRGSRTKMRDATFSSKAYGTHEYKELTVEGRVQLDMMQSIQRDHKLSSYSLNAVAANFLGEQKEDVHHSIINDLQNGNDETRRRLAVYCLKDAYLPQRLMDKLCIMYNTIEMARVTGIPMGTLLTRGQSIKVFSQLLRKARARGFLVPFIKTSGPSDGVAYEGATVLDPKVAYYDKPVATLDFASLYPSIMIAHNLCYSTLITPQRARELGLQEDVHLSKSPNGDLFVKADRQRGLVPEILEDLLAARKRAKADLKAEKDPFKRAVLDGRQLALKVSANSVYGFTGATIGKLPCLAISGSTTAYGRDMIMHTRRMVTERFTVANGYEHDCDVIYGDTDSVMVNFQVPDVARAMELGREAAEYVSLTFIKPVKLEFEKVYFPYLLMNKKRYAGLLWTRPDKHDKMDSKGIETVRRDNCLMVRNVVTTSLEKMLIDKDVPGAVAYVKGVISDLLMNKMDLSLLVISKGLTQDTDEYETKVAHVELAKKMRKRDPATAPSIGDRVPYVIIKAAKGAKTWEKAEDPIYALEHNLAIDSQHYLEHHLTLPLTRIFEPIMKNPKELLTGDHTRSISVATPSSAAGGIMKFAKVRLSCLACKAPLKDSDKQDSSSTLCTNCQPRQAEMYCKTLSVVNELEGQYAVLWTQCQRCQGSLHQDVLCTSRDCPIFYRRKKVQKDLNETQAQLQRFSLVDNDW